MDAGEPDFARSPNLTCGRVIRHFSRRRLARPAYPRTSAGKAKVPSATYFAWSAQAVVAPYESHLMAVLQACFMLNERICRVRYLGLKMGGQTVEGDTAMAKTTYSCRNARRVVHATRPRRVLG